MINKIKVGKSLITNNSETYFIADIAANWDGDIKRAKKLIKLAAKAGANAAKFQNFNAETIISDYGFKTISKGKKLSHQKNWKGSVYDIYKKASLPLDWTSILKKECDKFNIDYFTTPYDMSQINYLSKYCVAWKIGSGDITWHQLIKKLSEYNLPIMLATGASDLNDIKKAVKIIQKNKKSFILMQCNTNYTASLENFRYINLNVLKTFKKHFPMAVLGLSDHTPGHSTVLGAVTLGARVIEKHFTDDNNRVGPDHKFSMNPKTWKEMIDRTRELELSLGKEKKIIEKNETESVLVQRRSIRINKDIKNGTKLSLKYFEFLRPISKKGLEPYKYKKLIGKFINKDLKKGHEISFKDIKKN